MRTLLGIVPLADLQAFPASTISSELFTADKRIASMHRQSGTLLTHHRAVSILTHPLEERRRAAPER
jgi:hypothetical protein